MPVNYGSICLFKTQLYIQLIYQKQNVSVHRETPSLTNIIISKYKHFYFNYNTQSVFIKPKPAKTLVQRVTRDITPNNMKPILSKS